MDILPAVLRIMECMQVFCTVFAQRECPGNGRSNHGDLSRQYFFMLFIFTEVEGREEGGRETSMCGCLLCVPHWDLARNPGLCPLLGIELVTLWFASWH